MSAAEKLEALEMGGTEDDAELITMGYLDRLTLRDALPEIIAVVKAAEAHIASQTEHFLGDPDSWQPPLRVALSALDEALPDRGVATDSESPPLQ